MIQVNGAELLNLLEEEVDQFFEQLKDNDFVLKNMNEESIQLFANMVEKHDVKIQRLNVESGRNVPNLSFTQLPDCVELEVNQIGLENLPELPKCEILICVGNELTELPELPNVRELECGFNLLKRLPDLPNAYMVYCNHNKLEDLPDMPKIQYLNFNQNKKISTIPNAENLIELNCSNTSVEDLPKLPKCVKLFCNDNKITSMAKGYPSIRELRLNESNITSLPLVPRAVVVDCGMNQITKLYDMPFLEELICYDNKLVSLPKLPSLKKLICDDNKIKKISGFPKLEKLNCQNNELEVISDIPNIEELSCSKNPNLNAIVGYMPKLKTIKFSQTNLIPRELFKNAPNLNEFEPNYNPSFEPTLELLEQGFNGSKIKKDIKAIKKSIKPEYLLQIDLDLDRKQPLPQIITRQMNYAIERMAMLYTLKVGYMVDLMNLKAELSEEKLNELYEKYENEIKQQWDNYTVVDFLVAKYYKSLQMEFDDILDDNLSKLSYKLETYVKKLFKRARKLVTKNFDHVTALTFNSILKGIKMEFNNKYDKMLIDQIKPIEEEAKLAFEKNMLEHAEDVMNNLQ